MCERIPLRVRAARVIHPCGAALLCLAVFAAPGSAQTNKQRFLIEAHRTDRAPRIDGVLDDPAWQGAPMVDAFTQQEPLIGEPSTERTEVRILYDANHLYVSVHAYETDPAGIIATEMRRDAERVIDEDSFQLILDTFNDARNGYMFVTNPLGAKLEQQIFEEGEGSYRGNGTASNINRSWDGLWDTAARITEDGWTAEMAIPTSTLRFTNGDAQTWGINFMRNISHKNEVDYWAPVPKAYGLQRVSLAGTLTGLRSMSQGLDLKLKPFALSGTSQRRTGATDSTSLIRDGGLDVKYGLTSGLNLDLTYRTDFAQVEVDEQQVNLTRFSLLFPEKRDFFLENAALFNMGSGNINTTASLETDLFFTRRIGLSSAGQPVPIVGGVRLTGKSGAHNIGVMDIQTDSAFGKPGDNFLVGRYSHDVLRRSRVGAIYINKESVGGSAHFNRTMGADVNLALGRSLQMVSFVAKTSTPGLIGKDKAFYARTAYRSQRVDTWINYVDVEDNFNPEVGFVQRTGVQAGKAYFALTPRPGKAHIRVLEPTGVFAYIADQEGRLIARTARAMMRAGFDDGSQMTVYYQKNVDVLSEPFRIQPDVTIPVGAYHFDDFWLGINSSPARRVYGRLFFSPQQFYGGHSKQVNTSIGIRATNRLAAEAQYQRNKVDLPYGNFTVNLGIMRIDFAMSPRMTIRTLTQYNSDTHEVMTSIRYNLIYRTGSDLYVVYNDLEQEKQPGYPFRPGNRQLVLKLTYLLAR